MNGDRQARSFDAIVRVVLEILASEGYHAIQPRLVAKRACVSLTTIYKVAPTRDDLVVTALLQWMEANCYSGLIEPPRDASLFDGLMWVYRKLFEPWERNPRMLEAFHHARSGPGGERLNLQGSMAIEPVARAVLARFDPTYANDVGLPMTSVICGVIQQFAIGEVAVTEILPRIERTLFRLTSNNEALAVVEPRRARRSPRQSAGRSRR